MASDSILIERICGGYQINGKLAECGKHSLVGIENKLLVLVGTDNCLNFKVWCQGVGNLKAEEVNVASSVVRMTPGLYRLVFDFRGRKYVLFLDEKKNIPSVTDVTLDSEELSAEFLTIASRKA
ncbi:hypothetical protein ACFL3M_03285 [Patescibacteria group bacterium]